MKTKILILISLLLSVFLNAQTFNVKELQRIIEMHNDDVSVALPKIEKLKCKPTFEGDFTALDFIAANNRYKCPTIQEDAIVFLGMADKVMAIFDIELDEKYYSEVEKMLLENNFTTTNEVGEIKMNGYFVKAKIFTSKGKKKDVNKDLNNTYVYLPQPSNGKFSVVIE